MPSPSSGSLPIRSWPPATPGRLSVLGLGGSPPSKLERYRGSPPLSRTSAGPGWAPTSPLGLIAPPSSLSLLCGRLVDSVGELLCPSLRLALSVGEESAPASEPSAVDPGGTLLGRPPVIPKAVAAHSDAALEQAGGAHRADAGRAVPGRLRKGIPSICRSHRLPRW